MEEDKKLREIIWGWEGGIYRRTKSCMRKSSRLHTQTCDNACGTYTHARVNACGAYTHAHMHAPMHVAPTCIGFACMCQGY